MDKQLRELERRIAADGCQQDDVEAFIVRCMRTQDPAFILRTIRSWVTIYNDRKPKGAPRAVVSPEEGPALASISHSFDSGPINELHLNLRAIHRIVLTNDSGSSINTTLYIRENSNNLILLDMPFNIDSGHSFYVDAPSRNLEATCTLWLAPPAPLHVVIYGVNYGRQH